MTTPDTEPFDIRYFDVRRFDDPGDTTDGDTTDGDTTDGAADEHVIDEGPASDRSEADRATTDRTGAARPGFGRSDETARAFPGGATQLPRISKPGSPDPDVLFVESAFFKEPQVSWPESTPLADTGFGQYYSTQSLFEGAPDLFAEPDRADGPYAVLGLTRRANWSEISKAHRKLVSELHPDRYVDADDVVREAAERRVRDVNEAYAEIRRERAAGQGR